jgi:hypothetical protein
LAGQAGIGAIWRNEGPAELAGHKLQKMPASKPAANGKIGNSQTPRPRPQNPANLRLWLQIV